MKKKYSTKDKQKLNKSLKVKQKANFSAKQVKKQSHPFKHQ